MNIKFTRMSFLRAALLKLGAAGLPFRNALSLKISQGWESPPDSREPRAVADPGNTLLWGKRGCQEDQGGQDSKREGGGRGRRERRGGEKKRREGRERRWGSGKMKQKNVDSR